MAGCLLKVCRYLDNHRYHEWCGDPNRLTRAENRQRSRDLLIDAAMQVSRGTVTPARRWTRSPPRPG